MTLAARLLRALSGGSQATAVSYQGHCALRPCCRGMVSSCCEPSQSGARNR